MWSSEEKKKKKNRNAFKKCMSFFNIFDRTFKSLFESDETSPNDWKISLI